MQVFGKPRRGRGHRRCWQSRRFVHLPAGCHRTTVMHAHSGGTHGISLRVIAKHTWRCPAHLLRRIPERLVLHPLACGCDTLPAIEPEVLEAAPPPAAPPPPPPPSIPSTCPPPELTTMGWELCTWQLTTPPAVPQGANDLSTIPSMSVRPILMIVCMDRMHAALWTDLYSLRGIHAVRLLASHTGRLVGRPLRPWLSGPACLNF